MKKKILQPSLYRGAASARYVSIVVKIVRYAIERGVETVAKCRQLGVLLKKYHKPNVKEIRERLMRGDDPREIPPLQKLRKKLGLTRSREEYEGYLSENHTYNPFRFAHCQKRRYSLHWIEYEHEIS